MSRYLGPKNKLSRRESYDLFEKGLKMRRLNIPPGVHGHKAAQKKLSEFGLQLREKQKVKRFYGVLEKQFKQYYEQAAHHSGATGENLLQFLESRLDNSLVRAGFCPTRAMARQLITHKHIQLNGRTVNTPSYLVKPGQVVTLSAKALAIPAVTKLLASESFNLPKWIKRQAAVAQIERLPARNDVTEDFNDQAIVEFYSR